MLRPRRMPVDEVDAPCWTAQHSTTSRGPHVRLPTDGRAAPRSRSRRTDVRQLATATANVLAVRAQHRDFAATEAQPPLVQLG